MSLRKGQEQPGPKVRRQEVKPVTKCRIPFQTTVPKEEERPGKSAKRSRLWLRAFATRRPTAGKTVPMSTGARAETQERARSQRLLKPEGQKGKGGQSDRGVEKDPSLFACQEQRRGQGPSCWSRHFLLKERNTDGKAEERGRANPTGWATLNTHKQGAQTRSSGSGVDLFE